MKRRLLILFCAGWVGLPFHAGAQEPPVTVPAESQIVNDDANLALKKNLDQRYAALVQQFNDWNKQASAFNDRYGGRNLNADTDEAREGQAEQARVGRSLDAYQQAAALFDTDVAKLRLESPAVRVTRGTCALAKQLGWSPEKLDRLQKDFDNLDLPETSTIATKATVNRIWNDVEGRSHDAGLIREASQDGGFGFPGAGKQSFSDCTLFALANAAGLPYGVVAARAALLISQAEWRTDEERSDPVTTLRQGLNGGEVIMLAEAFGRADVVTSANFAETLKAGHPILVGIQIPAGPHEVVLTKTFQHEGEPWYVMMDSNQNPAERQFLSAGEMTALMKENGVVYQPVPGTTPQLLRESGAP